MQLQSTGRLPSLGGSRASLATSKRQSSVLPASADAVQDVFIEALWDWKAELPSDLSVTCMAFLAVNLLLLQFLLSTVQECCASALIPIISQLMKAYEKLLHNGLPPVHALK